MPVRACLRLHAEIRTTAERRDALPKNVSGKLLKRQLRRRYESGTQAWGGAFTGYGGPGRDSYFDADAIPTGFNGAAAGASTAS